MYPNWKRLLQPDAQAWAGHLQQARSGTPRVLFCSSVGAHGPVITHDSYLAAALVTRGASVEALLCDGLLPACELCTIYNLPVEPMIEAGPQASHCRACFDGGRGVFEALGVPLYTYSAFVTGADLQEADERVGGLTDAALRSLVVDAIALGEEAYAGTLRYFAVGDLADEPQAAAVLRRYLRAALIALRATQRLFDLARPDVVVFHHGIYVPQGVIGRVARQRGVRVVNWSVGYRKQTFVYSHDDTYHRTMIDEPLSLWQERALTPAERARLLAYLDSRRNSSQDWIKFNQEPEENGRVIRARLGLDERPVALLLTNVTWDAQLYYKNNGFPSLLDWLEFTIRYFERRPDLQLVIRVHPGEVRGTMRSRQPVLEAIERRIGRLPANVYAVDAASDLSTYALAELADSTLIFGTKTGVELTARGLVVVVAGEAWIRNKGLTIDVRSQEEYRALLDRLPLQTRLDPQTTEAALRYANHYFFRRLVPLRSLVPVEQTAPSLGGTFQRVVSKLGGAQSPALIRSSYSVALRRLSDLQPGADPGLDLVCSGILAGVPFVYEEQ